jgi:uncharacterized repeat protein (TIGR01451 family)
MSNFVVRTILAGAFSIATLLAGTQHVQAAPAQCSGEVELWFLNDESTSVTDTEFASAKSFLNQVSSGFNFDATSGFRGALVAWATSPTLVSGLTGSFSDVALNYARVGNGSTYPGAALAYTYSAIANYNSSTYKTSGGAEVRSDVPSIVVMMTDANGVTSGTGSISDAAAFTTAADNLRNAGQSLVIMLIAEAADRYDTTSANYDSAFKTLMDNAAGGAANVIVGSTYDVIADPTKGFISNLSDRVCAVAQAVTSTSATMEVTKSFDATAPELAALAVDDTVTWTVAVENTGNVTLESVTLGDNLSAGGSDYTLADASPKVTAQRSGSTSTDTSFDPGDIWTWTVSYTLTQADFDAGKLENVASVTATPSGGTAFTVYSGTDGTASTSDTTPTAGNGVMTTLPTSAAMEVTKTETSTNHAVGDTLSWDIVVTNKGNVTLTGVSLSDDTLTRLDVAGTELTLTSGPTAGTWPGTPGVLAPDESVTFTASYTLTQDDIDAGGVANIATASGTAPDETPVTGTSDSDAVAEGNQPTQTAITPSAEIKITKTVDDSALADGIREGDVLLYHIVIENTGNVTLSDLVLTDTFKDANGDPLTLTTAPQLPATSLAVGESWEIDASFALTAAAIEAGGVSNIAMISGKTPAGSEVQAQSKVEGNSSTGGGTGTPTGTGFPGEISGRVLTYLAGAPGVTVYLLRETSPNSGVYEPALDADDNPISTVTDADGNYVFLNVPPGTYGVEFDAPEAGTSLATKSATAEAAGNRIVGISVDAGAVELHQDAFFVDPAGVIYDAETFAPISGARVTLQYNGTPVPDSWLNTVLGDGNGVLTGSDGGYFFLFDPLVAKSGTYTLVVEKAGYKISKSTPSIAGSYTPGLGGGLEKIVPEAVPSSGGSQSYYLAFDFVFTGNPATTSNGISNNHIPLDADLASDVKDEVTAILKDDLAATMTQQAQRMQGYAEGALNRLKSRDGGKCAPALAEALRHSQIHFATGSAEITTDSNAILDEVSQILGSCPDQRFEVAAHTDNVGDVQANLDLSWARADAVIAALQARGIEMSRLSGRGYGDTVPVADNATAIGRAANRRIEFALLDTAKDLCADSSRSDHAFSADMQNGNGAVDGFYQREEHDCHGDVWRIVSADGSLLRTDRGVDQRMMNISVRRERFVSDDRVSGRFLGAYATRSTITDRADGEILGFGVNAGVYGADLLSQGLYLDYYLGAAAGRHTFDLNFGRVGGVINATGHYSFGALFAGAALSGETKVQGIAVSPRAGVDLAWSPGGKGSLAAARGALSDSESLTIPAVMGGRAFVELRFEDLLSQSPMALAVTPRLLCDWGMGELSMSCGYGGSIELTSASGSDGTRFGVSLEGSQTKGTSSGTVSFQVERPIGSGWLKGGLQAGMDGAAGIGADYALEF